MANFEGSPAKCLNSGLHTSLSGTARFCKKSNQTHDKNTTMWINHVLMTYNFSSEEKVNIQNVYLSNLESILICTEAEP